MSSSTLFNTAGAIFLLIPIGHIQMYFDVLSPGLQTLSDSPAAYASKVSWNQANGYFLTSALLCFKWARHGVAAGLERYIFGLLMATHCVTGMMYARKGVPGPPLVYWSASLLMGIGRLRLRGGM
ncbi:hypothetical protein M430DRAFT_37111 [Amorphotheca resinae ATCC 22711]|uniref:Ergosterol biosynthesis protein n=1 Tax=Amorphotheca resinae ATCC 22711 TaxID=857342 RepID=A0A2T3ARH6_AMORE|nr:hypothetical protein M430DRAFT_37111 [Amorphotheca resinae ATCC 22711]PSS08967.1 hypothetical protein M430DRAFT_37111 [Amorphotheca resinae ATCC 22711]